jgi:beta-lactamase superfamily II metal-dependent hydrolase
MAFDGIEIDMLSLGDADSLLVTLWEHGRPTYTLIDGGYAKDARTVTSFLQRRGIKKIHHLVCSHMDNDHAAGLLRLVQEGKFEIGCGWVHRPDLHVDMNAVRGTMRKAAAFKEARIITNSLDRQMGLAAELIRRGVDVVEPFEGEEIGFLKVLGPSEDYYEELVGRFDDIDTVYGLLEQIRRKIATFNESYRKKSLQLLDDPELNAENLSSTILGGNYDGEIVLIAGDSGNESLTQVRDYKDLVGCRWMQIPHHGSINNITQSLVDFFRPKTAYVSAEGNKHHPHDAVVHAFKEGGTTGFSTHHPNGCNLCHRIGDVPLRNGYFSATPL